LRRLFACPRRHTVRLRLVQLESRLAPAVSLLNHFDAIGYDTIGYDGTTPPDTCGAAGPNSYIETVNSAVAIYNKSTNALIAWDSLSDFLFTKGGLSSSWGLHDATMVYDEVTGQFLIGDLGLGSNNAAALNIAVSNNSNPTSLDGSSWNLYTIITGEGDESADFPCNMGYNADAFVFTLNMAPSNVFGTWRTEVVALSQSDLAAGGSTLTTTKFNISSFFGLNNWSMRPVTMHDSTAGGPMWLVSEDNHLLYNTIDVTRIDNILTGPGISSWAFTVNAYGGVNAPLNPNGTAITTDIHSAILKAAERYNDIVACQNVGVGNHEDDARWYEFNVSDPNNPYPMQQGNVGFGPNTYTVYPAIDINPNGDIAMGFTKSGNDTSTDYMSTYITGWKSFDPAGTMEAPVEVRAGDSNNGDGREGDFSGINVDPNDGTFWVADEYASGGTWGTELANFAMNTQTAFVIDGVLYIGGDQLANPNDSITIDENARGGVLVTLNGERFSFDPGAITELDVYPGISRSLGSNTINVYNTSVPVYIRGDQSASDHSYNNVYVDATSSPLTGDGGSHGQYVAIGNTTAGVQDIYGYVNVYNSNSYGSGYSNLYVYDAVDSTGRAVSMYDGALSGLAPAPIYWSDYNPSSSAYYSGVSTLTVLGGYGSNTWRVYGDNSYTGASTYLFSGSGNDLSSYSFNTVYVYNTTSPLEVDGGDHGQGVTIGNAGSVQGILGPVYVSNPRSSGYGYSKTFLAIDDQADTTGRTVSMYDGALTGLAPAAISWMDYNPSRSQGGVSSLTVLGSSGYNTWNVNGDGVSSSDSTYLLSSSGSSTSLFSYNSVYVYDTSSPLTLDGGAEEQVVTVGASGSAQAITGSVNVINSASAGYSDLYVYDSNDTTGRTVTMTDGSLTGLAPAAITLTASATGTGGVIYLDVIGSGGGSTYTLRGQEWHIVKGLKLMS
jgi:hypothetical protein